MGMGYEYYLLHTYVYMYVYVGHHAGRFRNRRRLQVGVRLINKKVMVALYFGVAGPALT